MNASLRLLRLLLATAILWGCHASHAATSCVPSPSGTLCTSQIDFNRFAQTAFQSQNQSQWCWAASISMVFGYYGYSVSQARIVAEAYGSVVNMPAVAGVVMAQALNRSWVDDNNRPFIAHLSGAYDPAAGIRTLDNNRLINELDRDRPFIVGTAGHAVVVTAVQYLLTPTGPYVVAIGVFDPWPGRGARTLSPAEATPIELGGALTFVATADVQSQAGSGSAIQNPFSSGSGGGASDQLVVLGLLALVLLAYRRRRR